MQWFRMYAEAVDDEKLRMLAFEDRWHFVALLCLKAGGTLDADPATLERRMSIKLGLAAIDLGEMKKRLMAVSLISEDWQPLAWGKRQFTSDISTSRVQKHRLKRSGNVSETSEERFGNGPEAEAETEQSKSARRKRASRLPEDFSPDLEYARKAIPDIDAEAEFARFRDYWTAKSGANGTKADWPATWRNWIRNCQESGRYARRKEEARAPRGLPILNG